MPGTTHGGGSNLGVADFNGDGRLDFVTTATLGGALLRLGNGDGTFGSPTAITTGVAYPGIPAGADMTGDGVTDLVVRGSVFVSGVGYHPALAVVPGNGDGSFQPAQTFSLPAGEGSFATADFDDNGLADVAIDRGGGNGVLLLNDGDWSTTPPAATLRINDVSVTEGDSGTTDAVFTVTLSTASSETVTVDFATGNTPGGDYLPVTGTLTFAPGETSKTITVLVYGDIQVEGDEVFAVNLSNAIGATILDGHGAGTIVNDDVAPPPTISIGDVTKAEGRRRQTTAFTFTVTLSAASDQPVTVSYRTANGTAKTSNSDYVAKSGTITFAPGETEKTITITVKGDSKREATEYFYLDLFDATSDTLFTKSRGVGTILNDD
jgi:hypothetical protein